MPNVVELRQYTLHPGRRDELIELFDREFVQTQEAEGMTILGQFRDLDRPDRFVWLRGFDDMARRADALTRFYSGPAWKANSAQANATMVDIDDVLLLQPATPKDTFPEGARDATGAPSLILATIYFRDDPFAGDFDPTVDSGATPIVCLRTLYAENTFPALPVRAGVHAFVWLARFPDEAALDAHVTGQPVPDVSSVLRLRLSPTARSALR
jgi:quinol monooxygenase YgiN